MKIKEEVTIIKEQTFHVIALYKIFYPLDNQVRGYRPPLFFVKGFIVTECTLMGATAARKEIQMFNVKHGPGKFS